MMENQIFRKTLEPIPDKSQCFMQNEFKKLRNNKSVTLSVTKTKIYILYEKGTLKCADIEFDLRFQLRSETRELICGFDEVIVHQEKIFVLRFEKQGYGLVEFYNKNQSVLNWRLLLKEKLNMLNYQHFFKMERLIGSGGFASVYEAKRNMDGESFAAKAFYKKILYQNDPKAKSQIQNEINMLRLLNNHLHITKLFEVYENQSQIYLIMELAKGGTLEDLLGRHKSGLPQSFIKHIFYQILLAVQHMHSKGIMHRDIKPSNINFRHPPPSKLYMLESVQSSIIVGDLGLATPIKDKDHIYTQCGSAGYMAPEIFTSEVYDEKVDIFSLGCVLFQLHSGQRLFPGTTQQALYSSNQNGQFDEHSFVKMGDTGTLLDLMLSKEPENRPNIQTILQMWLQDKKYSVKKHRPISSPPKRQLDNILKEKTRIRLEPINTNSTSVKSSEEDPEDMKQEFQHLKIQINKSFIRPKRASFSNMLSPVIEVQENQGRKRRVSQLIHQTNQYIVKVPVKKTKQRQRQSEQTSDVSLVKIENVGIQQFSEEKTSTKVLHDQGSHRTLRKRKFSITSDNQ